MKKKMKFKKKAVMPNYGEPSFPVKLKGKKGKMGFGK